MKKRKIAQFASVVIACALLTACATPPMYYDAQDNVSSSKDKITQENQTAVDQAKAAQNAVVYKDSMYVDDQPIDLSQQPAWLKNTITVHGSSLPFSFYSKQVINDPNVITTYQTDLEQNKTITLNYSGSVQGALQVLSSKTGYTYTVHNNQIYWQEYITKTFDIAFLPGDATYLVGKSTGGSSGSSGNSGSGGSGSGSTSVISGGSGNADDEYNNIQGTMSVWTDLSNTIKSMLSKNGSVIISQSTTSITVHDTPERVRAISDYVKQVNANLSKEVMIKVQVLDVNLDKSFNYGIDWALAAKFIGRSTFKFNGNFSEPVSLSPLSGASSSAAGAGIATTGSSAIINALSQQGTVSISTEPTVVTTNNQVASINLLSQVGYLAQISNTSSTSQESGGQTQTTLTPGQVSTGFTIYILPKVIGNKIYMQISSDLSSLLEIRDLYSSTTPSSDTSSSSGQVGSKIQVPDIDSKSFNQRSIVTSGTTLILAGFNQLTNRANEQKMFGVAALGGKGAEQKDVETIVLVTPYILNND